MSDDQDRYGWLKNYKLPIALSLVGLVLIIGGIFTSGVNKPRQFPKESLVNKQKLVSVDVSGAVNKPGVYQLNEGARIEEAVILSGGFSETANKEYISKYLNMAQKLADGSKVYVPFEGESTSVSTTTSGTSAAVSGVSVGSKVNINTATQPELEALSGIGSVTAFKIISNRPYNAVEDLLNKKVIGKSVFEKIKDSIVVY